MRGVAFRLLLAAMTTTLAGTAIPVAAAEATQAQVRPRQAVKEIAGLIRDDFYDAGRADRIARDLEKADAAKRAAGPGGELVEEQTAQVLEAIAPIEDGCLFEGAARRDRRAPRRRPRPDAGRRDAAGPPGDRSGRRQGRPR